MIFSDIKLSNTDYGLILIVCVLILIGLAAIYSASFHVESSTLKSNFTKQIIWFFLGIIALVATILIPLRVFWSISYWAYGISIILLILPLFLGSVADVHRWIVLGPIKLQPSEFAKIGVLLALVRYLAEDRRNLNNLKEVIISFVIIIFPFLLVVKQPDLGTALVFASLILPVIYWAGLPTYLLFIIVAPFISLISAFNFYTFLIAMIIIASILFLFHRGLRYFIINMILNISVGVITPFLWGKLHSYQQHRILTFLGLELDPRGAGYQVIQSKVAIGSGGFWGKGFLNGTQTQLRFLPAQHTDFVFSVIGEEFGFIGVTVILTIFYLIIIRGIYIASVTRNTFASLLTMGVVTIIGFHVVVTIGMTVGMMPVTGIPLPFISYGGSSLITNMILVGFIINASTRRYKY